MATATAKRGLFKKLRAITSLRKMTDSSDEEEYIGPLEAMYSEESSERELMGASSARHYSSRRRGSSNFEQDEEPAAPTSVLVTCDNIEHETEWEATDTICLDHLRLTPDILQWVSTNCSPTLQEIRFLPHCVFLEEGQEALQTLLNHATLTKVVFEGLSFTFYKALEKVLKSKKSSTCKITQVDLVVHETQQCAVISTILPKLTHVRLRGPTKSKSKGMEFCCTPSKIDWTRAKKLHSLSLVTTNPELLSVLHRLPKTLHTLDLSHSSLQLPEVLDALTTYLSSPDCRLRELVRKDSSHCMAGEEICRILQSGHSLKVLDLKGCAMISLADLVRVCRLLEFNHTLERLDITPASIRSNQSLYKPFELEAAQESIRTSLENNLTLRWFLCKGLRFHDMTFFGSGQRF